MCSLVVKLCSEDLEQDGRKTPSGFPYLNINSFRKASGLSEPVPIPKRDVPLGWGLGGALPCTSLHGDFLEVGR